MSLSEYFPHSVWYYAGAAFLLYFAFLILREILSFFGDLFEPVIDWFKPEPVYIPKPETVYISKPVFVPTPAPVDQKSAEIKRLETALEAVNNPVVSIIPKPLLNHAEREVFMRVREFLAEPRYSQFLLMAQVSLGELFNTKPFGNPDAAEAYYAYNSRRSDLVIIDRDGNPVLIIEYQGGGHFQKAYYLRDEIKRRVFQRAKVRALEIAENLSPQEAAARVREQLDAILPTHPQQEAIS